MDPSVERLRQIMPPPGHGDDIDWESVESSRGFALPSDYREFIAVYGGGLVDGFLKIHTPPVEASALCGLPERDVTVLERLYIDELEQVLSGPVQYPAVAFSFTEDGDEAMWYRRTENPDEWPVLVWVRHSLDYHWMYFADGMAKFLLALLTGEIGSPFLRVNFPAVSPTYMSWREWNEVLGYDPHEFDALRGE